MTLLERVVQSFEQNKITYALVGAAAMALHGVGRSTFDTDFLTTDSAALSRDCWKALRSGGTTVDIRAGGADDPLAGAVRFRAHGNVVDLMVGRGGWQSRAVRRAGRKEIGSVSVPVVSLADLILLKLYAGGVQDRWDIQQLLAANRDELVHPTVASEIPELPPESRALWKSIVSMSS